ncbi:MAG: hypothetical protein ACR2PW_07555 [Gammaproteobacteria bacterium]
MSTNKVKKKMIAPSYCTAGGGFSFEARVQASFVVLMLTGGYAPGLRRWPIVEIELQGKINDFETDDIIVYVENAQTKERRKLLGQIKSSIDITPGNKRFGDVMAAAWRDYNHPAKFTRGKDSIALLTGPLSKTDSQTMPWLLNHARHTPNVDKFLLHVKTEKFSAAEKVEKLEVIQHHLKVANAGNDVSGEELYVFLNHFHLLGYDFDNESSVVASLLHSHISQFDQQRPQSIWSRVVDIVQTWSKDAGTLTRDSIPEDIKEVFEQKSVVQMPAELKMAQEEPTTDWTQHPDASYLTLAILMGGWDGSNAYDRGAIAQWLDIDYDEWLKKAKEISHYPDSPLAVQNGIWSVVNRAELLNQLGKRFFDDDLDRFRSLAVSILQERDPVFELPPEERYAARGHGKVLKHSQALRAGIAEGLAILGSQPEACSKCTLLKARDTSVLAIRELLRNADWVMWGSLSNLLPSLAEAAPNVFLKAVEQAMRMTPCPYDELFAPAGTDILVGDDYLTGLLWALEVLAWDQQYLVRVCVALGKLASHDSSSQWDNRPINSLVTILLPWLPQTLAPISKRQVAVQTVLQERPDIAWTLLIQLLPDPQKSSAGSRKPSWRKIISDGWENSVTPADYGEQISNYAKLAVDAAGQDTARLSVLIDHFGHLSEPARDQFLQVLASKPISELVEEQRLSIWEHLTQFAKKHRRFTNGALPDELITRIEQVAEQLAPTNPINLYQHLFTGNEFDLFEKNGNWEEQQRLLDARRETAILEIFNQVGVDGVIRFAETASSGRQVGDALAAITDTVIERALLPSLLNSVDSKHKALVSRFIWVRYHHKGWEWCDELDKSDWTHEQVGQFLAYLPFVKEAWDRASGWLQGYEGMYWTRTNANAYYAEVDLNFTHAIEKLIEYGRPHATILCLHRMLRDKLPIDRGLCLQALRLAAQSYAAGDEYHIVELIKFLQADPSVNQDVLFEVEWAYIALLNSPNYSDAAPQLLESRLASDPEFFCEVIRLLYRSTKDDQQTQAATEESRAIATNAWRLMQAWQMPPGTQKDGAFSEELLTIWLNQVKDICTQSGHLEVALEHIGKVLIHTPPDPDGLWIHRAAAAALNDQQADAMRSGFSVGKYNSRGAHWVDPTGQQERDLADQIRNAAVAVENAGFVRFATALRDLADEHTRDEAFVIDRYQDRHDS